MTEAVRQARGLHSLTEFYYTEIFPAEKITEDLEKINGEIKHYALDSNKNWFQLGLRLLKVNSQQLFIAGGYNSFGDYCKRFLGYSRQHIYKIMKLAQFMDKIGHQANNHDERHKVLRLFNLGFTKIYYLHTLPSDELQRLLKNGVKIVSKDGNIHSFQLEVIRTGALKKALKPKSLTLASSPAISRTDIINTLPRILKTHSNILLGLIKQQQNDLKNDAIHAERMKIIADYATTINECLLAMERSNNGQSEVDDSSFSIADKEQIG